MEISSEGIEEILSRKSLDQQTVLAF